MSEKTPQERFEELGRKLLAVPKSEVDTQEQHWRNAKKATMKKGSRKRKK